MKQKFSNSKNILPKSQDSFYPKKSTAMNKEQSDNETTKIEVSRLRAALTEAIDENEIMKGRII